MTLTLILMRVLTERSVNLFLIVTYLSGPRNVRSRSHIKVLRSEKLPVRCGIREEMSNI